MMNMTASLTLYRFSKQIQQHEALLNQGAEKWFKLQECAKRIARKLEVII